MIEGEIWLVNFPLEEDNTQFLSRPAVILNANLDDVLAIKVTKTEPRSNDDFDVSIDNWQYANLNYKSTARVSKTQNINKHQFKHKIGNLHFSDLIKLQNKYIEFINGQV